MAQNLQIDPVKKDYVFVNGSPVPSDRVLEAAYIALLIPKKKWIYGDSNQGSLLYTLFNQKRTASVEQTFAAYAKQAIQDQLIATGKASQVSVKNLSTSSTGTSNEVDVTPATTQVSTQLNFVPV